uniref:tRNA pseudouridine(55) synthase n=1 Tax=Caenorhabditis tropicalis TaxID=1561998 RepID=A0A1I7UDR9_9PELO
MSERRPLSYPPLKLVIQYMGPNIRFRVAQQCPSLRNIDKIVPQTFKNLYFEPQLMTFNDTTYQLGVLQIYKNGYTPEAISVTNRAGGAGYDVDQYGLPRISDDHRDNLEAIRFFEDQQLEHLEAMIRAEKSRPMRSLRRIRQWELEALPYRLRRDNLEPPYDHYIKLTIKTKKSTRVECIAYTKTIHEAKEYILNRVLGVTGRRIYVDTLRMGKPWNRSMDFGNTFLRNSLGRNVLQASVKTPCIPNTGKRVVVRNMILHENCLEALKPVLEEIPFKTLQIAREHLSPDDWITSAEYLCITGTVFIGEFLNFPNPRIHLQKAYLSFAEFGAMISMLQRASPKIGTQYSFGTQTEHFLSLAALVFEAIPGAKKRDLQTTVIAMENDTELVVSYIKKDKGVFCCDRFVVQMIVHPKGYSDSNI